MKRIVTLFLIASTSLLGVGTLCGSSAQTVPIQAAADGKAPTDSPTQAQEKASATPAKSGGEEIGLRFLGQDSSLLTLDPSQNEVHDWLWVEGDSEWHGSYTGEWRDEQPHGKGIFSMIVMSVFEGIEYPEQTTYLATWSEGKPVGDVTIRWEISPVGLSAIKSAKKTVTLAYKGELHGHAMTGKGIRKRSNGWIEQGTFQDGRLHGTGIREYLKPEVVKPDTVHPWRYVGEWDNDQETGYGIKEYSGGLTKAGEFRDGVLHGYGRISYPAKTVSGASYKDGPFLNGHLHGEGENIWQSGKGWRGGFTNSVAHGEGTGVYKPPTLQRYSGRWKDGKLVAGGFSGLKEVEGGPFLYDPDINCNGMFDKYDMAWHRDWGSDNKFQDLTPEAIAYVKKIKNLDSRGHIDSFITAMEPASSLLEENDRKLRDPFD